MFIIITAPHFTAGVVVGQNAAPIIHYMKTWSSQEIIQYCKLKQWNYQVMSK